MKAMKTGWCQAMIDVGVGIDRHFGHHFRGVTKQHGHEFAIERLVLIFPPCLSLSTRR